MLELTISICRFIFSMAKTFYLLLIEIWCPSIYPRKLRGACLSPKKHLSYKLYVLIVAQKYYLDNSLDVMANNSYVSTMSAGGYVRISGLLIVTYLADPPNMTLVAREWLIDKRIDQSQYLIFAMLTSAD